MEIKNSIEEITELAEKSEEDTYMGLKYSILMSVVGALLCYYAHGLLWWGGVFLLGLALRDFFQREGYQKGFISGYDAGVEDASPDSTEYKNWLSGNEDSHD